MEVIMSANKIHIEYQWSVPTTKQDRRGDIANNNNNNNKHLVNIQKEESVRRMMEIKTLS